MKEIKVKVYNFEGKEVGTEILDPILFNTKLNKELVQQVLVTQQANSREAIAHTKGRSEVRGGGKKPWKQKGTGRARHGSSRSPIWTGGGVTFGPIASRNFSKRINKKAKQKALAMVLTDKVVNNHLIVLESYNLPQAKTKLFKQILDKLPGKDKKKLIVTKGAEENIVLASKNLGEVSTINYGSLNIIDLLKNKYLFINKELLGRIKKHYL